MDLELAALESKQSVKRGSLPLPVPILPRDFLIIDG